jgi:hypothetical protein
VCTAASGASLNFKRMRSSQPPLGCCKLIDDALDSVVRTPQSNASQAGPHPKQPQQQHKDRHHGRSLSQSPAQHVTQERRAGMPTPLLPPHAPCQLRWRAAYMRQSCASMDTTAFRACSSARAPAAKFSSICPPLGNVCAKSTCRDCRAEHIGHCLATNSCFDLQVKLCKMMRSYVRTYHCMGLHSGGMDWLKCAHQADGDCCSVC